MKKLALCLMMLSLGLFSVGCTKTDDAGGGAAPAAPAGGDAAAPADDAAAPAGDAAAPAGDDAAAAPAGEAN